MNQEAKENHHIFLYSKKHLELKGIKQIDHFDEQEFLLESNMGWIIIKGNHLILNKWDVNKQEVVIDGEIKGINYVEHMKNHKKWFVNLLKA